jgi:hypothetical protein
VRGHFGRESIFLGNYGNTEAGEHGNKESSVQGRHLEKEENGKGV